MSMSATRTTVLGAAAGVIALMGMLTPASAKHGHHHHHRHIHGWYGPVVVSSYGGCGYYRWKWQTTGSRYWKAKYFACIY